MKLRLILEQQERDSLSPRAALSAQTRGREREEPECPVRPAYQRDRDRILHAKSFRRLMHKTQVFVAPVSEHYRTRLTHTLEVSQIARTIAKALQLNEMLAEAIALGHDLGHTPFGHAGERILDQFLPSGFKHFTHSLRVVEKLERDGQGLNLTLEVRDGIVKHSKGEHGDIFRKHPSQRALTLEGDVVRAADIVAYMAHDIDDAFRAGLLRVEDAPEQLRDFLKVGHSERLRRLVMDVIESSLAEQLEGIGMSPDTLALCLDLRSFLFEAVYRHQKTQEQVAQVEKILTELWRHVHAHPRRYFEPRDDEPLERQVTDFVAGMTDRYAIELYQRVFVPQPWVGL